MSEWKKYKLEEIADIIGGGTPNTTISEYWNGKIAWLTPRDLTGYSKRYIANGERSITEEGLKKSSARLMPKGTVLLSSRAPIGYIAISENEISTNQGFKSLVINENKSLNIFIYYWLKNNIDYLKSNGTGTTFEEISGSVIKQLVINLPPLPEQKAIASVLSSLDDKIDLLHRQNKTLEQMAETLFRQWFLPVRGTQTGVEEAKEDWEERPLSSIATFLNGLACQKYPPKNEVDKLPVLKIKELRNGFSEDYDWCTTNIKNEYIIKNGDVIFAWSASLMVKIWDGDNCILNQHLFKVTSNEFPKWYYYLWCKHYLKKFIGISAAHATTMGHIKRGDLDAATVLVPTDDEITGFSEIQTPIIDKIIANSKQLKKLVSMRDTLLPKLMSGEVKVKI